MLDCWLFWLSTSETTIYWTLERTLEGTKQYLPSFRIYMQKYLPKNIFDSLESQLSTDSVVCIQAWRDQQMKASNNSNVMGVSLPTVLSHRTIKIFFERWKLFSFSWICFYLANFVFRLKQQTVKLRDTFSWLWWCHSLSTAHYSMKPIPAIRSLMSSRRNVPCRRTPPRWSYSWPPVHCNRFEEKWGIHCWDCCC